MMSRHRIAIVIQALALALALLLLLLLLLAVAGVLDAVSAPAAAACQHGAQTLPAAPDSAAVEGRRHLQVEVCPCAGQGFALAVQLMALPGGAEPRDWMPTPGAAIAQRTVAPDTPPPIA